LDLRRRYIASRARDGDEANHHRGIGVAAARADEPKPLKIPTVMTRLVLLERVPCLPQ